MKSETPSVYIICTPSIALYDQKEIPKDSASQERNELEPDTNDPASLGLPRSLASVLLVSRVLMEPEILRWFSC